MDGAIKQKVIFRYIFTPLLLLIAIGVMLLFYYNNGVNEVANVSGGDFYSLNGQDSVIGPVTKDISVVQEVVVPRGEVKKIGLKFDKWENSSTTAEVFVELYDQEMNKSLRKWSIYGNELRLNGEFSYFTLDNPIVSNTSKTFKIVVTVPEGTPENTITLKGSIDNTRGTLKINGVEDTLNLSLTFYGTAKFVEKIFILISALFILLGVFLYSYFVFFKWKIEYVFLAVGLILGLSYIIIFPPHSAPDETAHIATCYYNADKLLGREPLGVNGSVMVRESDLLMDYRDANPGLNTYNIVMKNLFKTSHNEQQVEYIRAPLNVPMVAHLPQSLGVAMGFLMNLGAVPTLYLGKIFALLFYLLCCFAAIKYIPFAKMLIFTVALLPSSLELATSYSYDLTVMALSFLFIGYCLYLIYEKDFIGNRDYLILILIAAVLAPCKILYLLVCGLCVLIPVKKCRNKRSFYIGTALTLVAGFVTILMSRLSIVTSVAKGGNAAGKGNGFTIMDIISDIPNSILIFLKSFQLKGDNYFKNLFGGLLSQFDINLPWVIVIAFFVIILLSMLNIAGKEKVYFDTKAKIVCSILCLLMTGGIFASMWLDWTPLTSNYIQGVQGRYFIPFLPMILLLFQNGLIVVRKNIDRSCIVGICFLQLWAVLEIFTFIVQR